MLSGKLPLVRVWQRGQFLISAVIRRSTVSKTMSTSMRCSCPLHGVPLRSWPHRRHAVTGLVCVVVTVRRLSQRLCCAFGPRLRDPELPAVWVSPAAASCELGRLELREVFGVDLLEEHCHHDIHQQKQGIDQRKGVRACLALLLDGSEPGSAIVQLRAQRGLVDPRHHSASTARIAEITARRSPAGRFR